MSKKIDKSLLLKRIKKVYGLKSDSELAKHLGLPPTTLSSWKARNTVDFDRIYERCPGINFNFLLYGLEPHFLDNSTTISVQEKKTVSEGEKIELLKYTIEVQKELIGKLKNEINHFKSSKEKESIQ